MRGLLIAIGKPKPGKDSGEEPGMMSDEGPEKSYAREAFSAIKDDDEEGFIQAFLGAVRACSMKEEGGGYEPDGDEE